MQWRGKQDLVGATWPKICAEVSSCTRLAAMMYVDPENVAISLLACCDIAKHTMHEPFF